MEEEEAEEEEEEEEVWREEMDSSFVLPRDIPFIVGCVVGWWSLGGTLRSIHGVRCFSKILRGPSDFLVRCGRLAHGERFKIKREY